MPCKAVAASVAVADEFLEVVEIARRERFIFAARWYRVVQGVQYKTPPLGCGGSELGRREGSNLYIALPTPKGPRRAAVIAIQLSGTMLEHSRQAHKHPSYI
jgi:hypothetical protein